MVAITCSEANKEQLMGMCAAAMAQHGCYSRFSHPKLTSARFTCLCRGMLLASVLPLWRDPQLLSAHGDKMVQVGAH